MKKSLIERRREMLRADSMDIKPSTFIPELAKRHGISEDALWRDWSRRKGVNGWMIKLAAIGEVYDVIGLQLILNREKQRELERGSYRSKSLHLKAVVSGELRQLREEERRILGIQPIDQPSEPLPIEVEENRERLEGKRFYEYLKLVAPNSVNRVIDEVSRSEAFKEAQRYLEDHK
ncbi:MAG: hypothetical protein NWF07_09570 [Candidatus Bathyarchaeota archaeon]|nr:hypothetical protein [Candidatus Bathyarchaeota archaeon]